MQICTSLVQTWTSFGLFTSVCTHSDFVWVVYLRLHTLRLHLGCLPQFAHTQTSFGVSFISCHQRQKSNVIKVSRFQSAPSLGYSSPLPPPPLNHHIIIPSYHRRCRRRRRRRSVKLVFKADLLRTSIAAFIYFHDLLG